MFRLQAAAVATAAPASLATAGTAEQVAPNVLTIAHRGRIDGSH